MTATNTETEYIPLCSLTITSPVMNQGTAAVLVVMADFCLSFDWSLLVII